MSNGTLYETFFTAGEGGSGVPGQDGRGITSATVNGSGRLIITYTDTTTQDVGLVRGADGAAGATGAKGDKGDTGNTGAAGTNGTNGQGVPTGGTTGQILSKTSNADFATAWIAAPTGGGGSGKPWYFDVPQASTLTKVSGDASQLTITDDADAGLLVKCGPSVMGDISRVAYRTLTNKALDWDVVVHTQNLMTFLNYRKAGLVIMDSITSRHIIVGQVNEDNQTQVVYVAGMSGYGGALEGSLKRFMTTPTFYRASCVGSTLTFYTSLCGKNWFQLGQSSVTAFLPNRPDRIGFGINISTSDTMQPTMTVDCFKLTGPAV
ncbi:hypothetical protein [Sphingobium sp. KCTC 72723]|uniref:hypothetical protein n=1 Tax=Sphingobium sp. KCTC 72723 TaxID=2733867 RepID=UPI001CB6F0F4|nr:hypothetical protein [Sphingobium sp. KCTC 72723]